MIDVIYPLFLFGAVGVAIVLVCASRVARTEQRFVTRWLLIALAVRLGVATLFASFPDARLFHEDANGYEYTGMQLAMAWKGLAPPFDLMKLMPQNYGFSYLSAGIYYVLGQYAPLVSYFNCVVGTVTVFLVYQLARRLFHPIIAQRAALLTALVPSMVLWSSIAIKDAPMALLIVLGLSSCVAIKIRFSVWSVIGIAVSLIAIQPIRFYMVYFVGFAVVVSLLLERGANILSGVYKQLAIVGILATLMVMVGVAGRAQEGLEVMSLNRVSSFRHGMAISAHSGFEADADVSTPERALLFLPLGVAELLLGPFPWQFGSLRALMAAPETLYWWILFPSVLRGMWWMFRRRFAETSPLLIFAVTMTAAYSLVHGNVGSGFRQRAQIFIILFIFAALGQYRTRCLRARLDPNLLLAGSNAPTPAPAAAPHPVRA